MPNKDEIKNFSTMIEELANSLRCEYLDAILHHCSKTGFEVEVASTMLSAPLKAKIREQADSRNLLKKQKLSV